MDMQKLKLKNKKIKLFLASVILLLAFSVFAVFKTYADATQSGMGWLWGGGTGVPGDGTSTNVGWISVNNLNCDVDKNGFTDAACGGNNTTTASVSYGVNIPAADGALSGYAWSENIGWIDFVPAGPYPAVPNYSAQRIGNNLQGWARIVGIKDALAVGNSGGWQGWIKLNGTAQDGSLYGATINADGTLVGYGWSDELGWIDFSGVSIVVNPSCTNPPIPPSNSTLCPGDNIGLVVDTPISVVGFGSCGAPKCEYACNNGYTKIGNNCFICIDNCYDQACTSADCEKSLPRGCINPCNPGNVCTVNNCGNAAPCPACPEPSGSWKEVAPN